MKNHKLKQICEYIDNSDFFDFVQRNPDCPKPTHRKIEKLKKDIKNSDGMFKIRKRSFRVVM